MEDNNVITSIKKTRIELDKVLKEVTKLETGRSISIAYTNLQQARMNFGELGIILGATATYDHTKLKKTLDSKDIPPATDKDKEETKSDGVKATPIEIILYLRDQIEGHIELIEDIRKTFKVTAKNAAAVNKRETSFNLFKIKAIISDTFISLLHARQQLGVRLGEIRDKNKKDGEGTSK